MNNERSVWSDSRRSGNPSYRDTARRLQRTIAQAHGLDRAADVLERAFQLVNESAVVVWEKPLDTDAHSLTYLKRQPILLQEINAEFTLLRRVFSDKRASPEVADLQLARTGTLKTVRRRQTRLRTIMAFDVFLIRRVVKLRRSPLHVECVDHR